MMKKICSLMLALMLVLFAVPSLAETMAATPFGLTFEARITVNPETVLQLAGAFGATEVEGMEEVIGKAINILNNASVRAAVDGTAAQGELLLKDQSLAMIAGKFSEDGVVVVSDVLPSYVLTLSGNTIKEMMGKVTEAMNGLQSGELAEAIAKYITPLTDGLEEKIGEPETVSYTFEGTEFTVKMPINLTAKEIMDKMTEAMKGLLSEKSVKDIFAKFDIGEKEIEDIIADMQEVPEDQLPEMAMAVYTNEAGDMLGELAMTQDGQEMLMQGGSIGGKIAVRATAPQMTMSLDADPAAGVVNVKTVVDAEGMKIASDDSVMVADNMLTGTSTLSVNDAQLLTVDYTMIPEGTVTADFSMEGKTELKMESLMQDGDKAMETLQQAVMPGLMGLLTKAMQIMPDEINEIMQMLTPSESAVTESAGE